MKMMKKTSSTPILISLITHSLTQLYERENKILFTICDAPVNQCSFTHLCIIVITSFYF